MVPKRGRRAKRKVPESPQKDQEGKAVPVRPLRRKDSLTPDRKVKKVFEVTVPTQPDTSTSVSVQTADAAPSLQSKSNQESIQKPEAESVSDIPPPLPPVRKRDSSLPPFKPLRRKDRVSRDSSVPKAAERQDSNTQTSSALETTDAVPPAYEQTSEVSQTPGPPQDADKLDKNTAIVTPLGDAATVDQSAGLVGRLSPEAETEEALYPLESSSIKASSDLQLPEETKGKEEAATRPESEIFPPEQTTYLSIIKKIQLPQRGKRLPSRRSQKAVQQKCEESVTAAQVDNTDVGYKEDEKQLVTNGNTTVDTVNITSQKEEEASERAETENKEITLQVPKPPVRKRLSVSFPDNFTATESSSDVPFTPPEEAPPVKLRHKKWKEGNVSEVTSLPVPKPRVKKRLSGSFMDDASASVSSSTPSSFSDTKTGVYESVQQNEPSGLLVPLPRIKKRLSASYSDSTPPADTFFPTEMEISQRAREETLDRSKETKDGSTSLDSSVISVGEDDAATELEREVLAAMREDSPYVDSVEDSTKEIMEGWTFTDQPGAAAEQEKVEVIFGQPDMEKVLEAEVDQSLASTVASSPDDWLHLEEEKDGEATEMKREVREEELDFDFVSVDVAAACLEEPQR